MHERDRDVARQPVEHAGLDERLGDEEHVRRARAGQPGDRVEQLLGNPDDDADRAEQPLGVLEVRPRWRGGPAAIAAAPCRTSAGVFGIARTTGATGRRGLERRDA